MINKTSAVTSFIPGEVSQYSDCRRCPGYGRWNHQAYRGRDLCFRKAIFHGKSGGPEDCIDARQTCGRYSGPGDK